MDEAISRVLEEHGDRLYRLCLVMLGSEADAEDAVQETLIKYLRKAPAFTDAAHEKAWLLKVAANQCRDLLRYRARHPLLPPEAVPEENGEPGEDSGILEALMTLPEKYRLVLVLRYVEEYPVADIARLIGRPPSAVKMRLQKGRKLLEETYRKEFM